jgi:hypothetical protein
MNSVFCNLGIHSLPNIPASRGASALVNIVDNVSLEIMHPFLLIHNYEAIVGQQ